jgi:hypothetical protein
MRKFLSSEGRRKSLAKINKEEVKENLWAFMAYENQECGKFNAHESLSLPRITRSA